MNPDPYSKAVVVQGGIAGYPDQPPFHAGKRYPESPFPDAVTSRPNPVYAGVREMLRLLAPDAPGFGTTAWNPLGGLVRPGDRVTLKPNLVRHWNGIEPDLVSLVTHGSVVRALLDYVLVALEGRGEITVGDAPVQEADFDSVVTQNGLKDAVAWVASRACDVKVSLVDFRKERAHMLPGGVVLRREKLAGDPRGYCEVDLGRRSWLAPLSGDSAKFRVTNYDKGTMPSAHDQEHNKYLVARSVLDADVVISVPKMKTHGKAGITCALKNNVGINGHKDWLPHHRDGSREEGGDEYEHRSWRKRAIAAIADKADRATTTVAKRALYYATQALRRTARFVPLKDTFVEGMWHGNDTVWRMCLDLNRVLMHADREGRLVPGSPRRWLGVLDGIVAGEGDGPMHPRSKAAGLLVAGWNPVAIDVVSAHLMGFDPGKIPLLREAWKAPDDLPLITGTARDISVITDDPRWTRLFDLPRAETLAFVPPRGWAGKIELA